MKKLTFNKALIILSLIMTVGIFFRYIYPNILMPPEGDNLTIHIALAKSILNGTFLRPKYPEVLLYPSSNEALLALLILLKLPANIFNILGIIFLFIVSFYIGKVFGFKPIYSYFFALSMSTAYGVLRWATSQTIDIWLLTYFLWTLALLHKPRPSNRYYLLLGFSTGMLLGSRFTAPATLLTLFFLYYKNFKKYLDIKRFLIFATPLSILGLFWYVRNLLVTGNPFYPQPFLFFSGACNGVCEFLNWTVGKSIIANPNHIINAFVSEYMVWSVAFLLLPLLLVYKRVFKKHLSDVDKLIVLGIINLVIYFFFPSYKYYGSVVAGVRYSYPAFGALMLALFLIVKKLNRVHVLEIITFANLSFLILPITYHPKLLFIYVPLATLLFLHVRRKYFSD
jgi:hypothetical protein